MIPVVASILVVSSNSELRDRWRVELETKGHSVLSAETSVVGTARLREGGIDLVLLDDVVAGGIEKLLQTMNSLPDPPPFVLTSSEVDGPARSARLGAAEFLPKPCSAEELLALVGRLAEPRVPGTVEDSPTRPVERAARKA